MDKQLPIPLDNDPIIKEYLDALISSGKQKELNDTKDLLEYFNQMDDKFNQMINEIASLKNVIQELQNPTTRSRLSQLNQKFEFAFQHTKNSYLNIKQSFYNSIQNSMEDFKAKGKNAVIKTINVLHFKDALKKVNESLTFTTVLVDAFNISLYQIANQTREIKRNFKNIGRIITHKPIDNNAIDKSKLNIIQRFTLSIHSKLEKMTVHTSNLLSKLNSLEKNSVKKDIKMLTNNSNSQNRETKGKVKEKEL